MIDKTPSTTKPWQTHNFKAEFFSDLRQLYKIEKLKDWPDCQWLNQLGQIGKSFAPQSDFEDCTEYYEQIIYSQSKVPTRDCCLHDFFNGLIWQSFPQCKTSLNLQHMEDIGNQGLSPRTPRRNRITHFDECGVVLAYSNVDVPELLAAHQWKEAFVTNKDKWHRTIKPFMFGHANYEMLMNPFIGLTGKWLGVEVDEEFWLSPLNEQYQRLDTAVNDLVQQQNVFAVKGNLKPLPLLGIPGWWQGNEDPTFYDNSNYFCPKRST